MKIGSYQDCVPPGMLLVPETRVQRGNFPHAYSHVGVIHAACAVSPPWSDVLSRPVPRLDDPSSSSASLETLSHLGHEPLARRWENIRERKSPLGG
jgi:hypothetical protein